MPTEQQTTEWLLEAHTDQDAINKVLREIALNAPVDECWCDEQDGQCQACHDELVYRLTARGIEYCDCQMYPGVHVPSYGDCNERYDGFISDAVIDDAKALVAMYER